MMIERPRRLKIINFAGIAIASITGALTILVQWSAIKSKLQSSNTPQIINLPSFQSTWVGGQYTVDQVCGDREKSYEAQHPGYTIILQSSVNTEKDLLGRTSYLYTCYYKAMKK